MSLERTSEYIFSGLPVHQLSKDGPYTGVLQYIAFISQSSTDDPTAVVRENTLGETPRLTRDSIGHYLLTVTAPLFVSDRSIFRIKPLTYDISNPEVMSFFNVTRNSDTQLLIYTSVAAAGGGGTWASPVATDGLLNNTPLEILIYRR